MGAETRDELVGRHGITDFVDLDAVEALCERIAALREAGDDTAPLEAQIVRPDGTSRSVEAVAVLTLWEGAPAYQIVLRDVSARKAARDAPDPQQRQFETIVDLLDEGVVVMRNDGHIKFVNPAARRIWGLGPEHLTSDFAKKGGVASSL